jgi:phage terminase Nu1 subunit (DNA packaging protein)
LKVNMNGAAAGIGSDSVESFAALRRRLGEAQAQRAELDLSRRAGELLERRDVERTWLGFINASVSLLEALPRAAAPRVASAVRTALAHQASPEAAVEQLLTEEIRRVRIALAGE